MYKNFIKSAGWMFAGNASQQILQFVTFIILARQLAPEIFGQVALASVVTDVAGAIAIWGLPQFLTQRGILAGKLQAHAFVLAVSVSAIISFAIVLGVGVFSYLKEFSLVAELILLQTPLLLIQALGIVPDALLRRNLEFKWIAIRNNLAAIFGGATALVMAYMGLGVYALVGQKIVALSVMSLAVWLAARKRMVFIKPREYKFSTMIMITKQSLKILSNQIATLTGVRAMDAIIGIWLGTVVLGQFKIVIRIYDLLVQLAVAPLSSVAFGAFPKLASHNEELRKFYNNLVTFSLIIFVPVMTGVAVTANNWVPLVLGEKWYEVIPLFQIIAATSVQCILGTFQNSLQVSLRWNHFIFKQNIARVFISVALTFVAAQLNIYLILIFYAVQAYGLAIYNAYAINKARDWPWSDTLKQLGPSLIPTAVMVSALAIFGKYTQAVGLEMLAFQIMIGVAVYTATFLIFFPSKAKSLIGVIRNGRGTVLP